MPVLNDALDIRLGANPVSEVYLGTVKVWPKAAAAAPVTVTHVGKALSDNQRVKVHTFADVPLGSPVDRQVIIAIGQGSGAGGPLESVTIAGIPATIDVASASHNVAAIARATVPAGIVTGDVVVTVTSLTWRVEIYVYECHDWLKVIDTANQYIGANAPALTGTVDTVDGGFAIGQASVASSGAGITWTWTGLTEEVDNPLPGESFGTASGATNGNPLTVTATPSLDTGDVAGFALASYGRGAPPITLTYRTGGLAAQGTLAGVDLGPASPTRSVVVVVGGWSGGRRDVLGVTVGGIALTQDEKVGGYTQAAMFHGLVPTGATADVVVNAPDILAHVAVWTADSPLAVASHKSVAWGFVTPGMTVDLPTTEDGGFAVAVTSTHGNANDAAWNITERYDTLTAQPVAAADAVTHGSPLSVTTTPSVTYVGDDHPSMAAVAYKRAP